MLARQTGVALAPADTARRVLRWLALRGSPADLSRVVFEIRPQ